MMSPDSKELAFASREDGSELQLDLYLPGAGTGLFPVVAAFFGGGFITGDKAEWYDFSDWFTSSGFALVAPNYRLFPDNSWPASFLDARDAVRWVRKEGSAFGLDGSRIATIGRSSGGFLALMLAAEADLGIRCAIGEATPVAPANPRLSIDQPWLKYLNDYFADWRDAQHVVAPDLLPRIDGTTAPCLLLLGEHDGTVPPSSAEPFVERMKRHHRPARVVAVPGSGHGVLEHAPSLCRRVIVAHLPEFLA